MQASDKSPATYSIVLTIYVRKPCNANFTKSRVSQLSNQLCYQATFIVEVNTIL